MTITPTPAPSPSLIELLKRIAKAFEEKNVPYAVSGALALMIWGFVRATRDIDLIISVPSVRLPQAIETLFSLGCKGEIREAIAQLRKDHFMTFTCNRIEIEVFIPVLSYHDQIIKRRVQKDVEGIPVWFVTAEDLVVIKMLFQRTKDIADVKGVVATLREQLDRNYVQRTLKEILPEKDSRLKEMEGIFRAMPQARG
ncbi:MAG: nucleotidyltransferase [Planctomycetes bacterium]|nr:nucleotidyltransferase [Planctomycetota bacterium]